MCVFRPKCTENVLYTAAEIFQRFWHFYRPVYGLIFLFKWLPGDHNNQGSLVMDSRRTEIFFAKQVMIMSLCYCATSCDLRWSRMLVLHKPSSVYSWIVNTATLNWAKLCLIWRSSPVHSLLRYISILTVQAVILNLADEGTSTY